MTNPRPPFKKGTPGTIGRIEPAASVKGRRVTRSNASPVDQFATAQHTVQIKNDEDGLRISVRPRSSTPSDRTAR